MAQPEVIEEDSNGQKQPSKAVNNPATPVTYGLIILIVFMYIYTSPQFTEASAYQVEPFVFYPEALNTGEWWRLLSANLVHADLKHLGSNAFGILVFGRVLEPVLGWLQTLGIVVTTGVCSMGFSYLFLDSPTLGASGIAYGFIACYMTMTMLLILKFGDKSQLGQHLKGLIFLVILYAYFDISRPNINYWGHLGGVFAGVIYSVVLFNLRIKRFEEAQSK